MVAGISEVTSSLDPREAIIDRRWFAMGTTQELMLSGKISASHTIAGLAVANAFIDRHPEHPIPRRTV